MADRFPSLEEFDSGAQTEIKDSTGDITADDFLAREKAVLGADADQFATVEDATAFAEPSGDLLGEADAAQSSFESQFPDLTSPSAGAAGGLPGVSSVTGPTVSYNSGYQPHVEDEEEPEVIKEWRERRNQQIAKRAEQFAAQREETIKEAQQNIDDFYENYNSKKEKGIAQTRKEAEQFLANQEDTVSGGTSWDRIAKLVDVSGKGIKGGAAGSGKERFREMLTSLRKDEKAPGATGY
ncbi:clathrin light chain [Ophiocordyceps camponoti-floridani]|uniref:Clathrin light chain n=1 Tax=Ophiocordyceps camponoti-floridani TaxID=2030778 RepID=A0A8H4Q2G2_9HYPO|nr:clathrin light chain [Ophiocordyceps camponoti-floridani]